MADATRDLFVKKSFVVITGASRGLGKCIASKLVANLPRSSFFLFLSRNNAAQEIVASELSTSYPGAQIGSCKFDQGHLDQNIFDTLFTDVIKKHDLNVGDFEQAVIVHNCATVGDVSKYAWEMMEVASLQKFFDVNVTGMILLNSAFFKTFSGTKSRLIVNMTSDNSKIPYPTMSTYCASKSARDMYFRVLALEDPSIRVLSYSPGPCDTDMLANVRDKSSNKEFADDIKKFYSEGKVLTCDTSADKLVAVLRKNTFKNAEHVEYDDPL
ncbi:sepiapterin reductase-like [Mizuhopecten yessoensis]|uniref:Sepiapterin reductase n=1 Tax=Mizuhopecten yessoensis TaxID=6573 RepID=A0A210QG26_MIZYE|nr:sepiapterin reductase-like [Mizuhopecten yessoensis]OWF47702.1 Sepiapterin reductase [Mizuhopecten yessoensis]